MGSGILAKGVKELLKSHPLIKSFEQAPPNMGGMGATLVKL
jgi:DNA mismatch repair protein MutS2